MAAAIGAGLGIDEPAATTVVDVGGGTSEVAVISLGGTVVSEALRLGGYDLDEAIAAWVRANCGLAIGEVTAERVKLEVGCCMQLETPLVTQVRGRDPVTGLPREADVTSDNVREAIEAPIVDIIDATKATLEQTPPELASDITERGITLAGGGALLRGFAERIELETRVPVAIADEPLTCVALGAALALEEMELLERTATAV